MLPLADRPRERLQRCGPLDLTNSDLLAVVLGTGGRGSGSAEIAGRLVERFPDLRRMALAGVAELATVPGVGVAQACRVKAALALAGRLGEAPYGRGEPIRGPREVCDRVGHRLAHLDREVFVALALDTRNRVLAEMRLAEGGSCSVDIVPRDVYGRLLREAAAGVVFVHNHPSGDPSPSAADRELTRRLTDAGDLVGVRLVDHVICAGRRWFSFSGGILDTG